MKKVTYLILWLLFYSEIPALGNLIVNGDFEAGNTDFYSDYGYVSGYPVSEAGTYTIGTNPADYHWNWVSCGDHTSGHGNMMIVNGAIVSDVTLWEQTISVSPNTDYEFSLWLLNCFVAPAHLEYFINDTSIGNSYVPEQVGEWAKFSQSWQSGLNSTATIRIIDLNIEGGGNDFAIDDISFIPEPATLLFLGLGSLALLRKHKG